MDLAGDMVNYTDPDMSIEESLEMEIGELGKNSSKISTGKGRNIDNS